MLLTGVLRATQELTGVLGAMGEIDKGPEGRPKFNSIVSAMDTDGDGQIDFEEFVEWFLQQTKSADPKLAAVLAALSFEHYTPMLEASGWNTLESLSWEIVSRSDLQGAGMKVADGRKLLGAVKVALLAGGFAAANAK